MPKVLAKLIAASPTGPGVYKFLNEKGEPLYVGKAKNLRNRLKSYVQKATDQSARIQKMLEHAESVEWIETNNEVESLILEDNLIKELQPRYNVCLRDDKTFQYIKVTVKDDYPEVTTVRKIAKDGSRYFGPKTSGADVRELMDSVKKIFKLCSVRGIRLDPQGTPLPGAKAAVRIGHAPAKRPCLDFHIKRCTGPCAGMVTPGEYRGQISAAVDFLAGNFKPALEALRKQMMELAAEKKFERAGALRDQVSAIERAAQKQLITDTAMPDRDVIGFADDLGKNYFVLFQIRAGKLIAQERFISQGEESAAEVMEAFLREYYALAADIPKEIFISVDVQDLKAIEGYIRHYTDHAVHLVRPLAGYKDDLIMLALQNARAFATASRVAWESAERKAELALAELQKVLKLPATPKRLEGYDISHLGGTETIGSMVVAKNGLAAKADYRQFRLRSTAAKNDDYASLEEVLTRRLNYLPPELPEGYKIRKAKKGDFEFIEKTCKKEQVNDEDLNFKQFQVIEKGKKVIGFGRLRSFETTVDDISSVWIAPEERGKKLSHFLIKKLIEQSKNKRVYLDTIKGMEDHYFRIGFEQLHQAPKALLEKIERARKKSTHKNLVIVYMAYQKKKRDLSFEARPDLIMIDGGKGQLGVAVKVLGAKGLAIPVISLAKEKEEVFVPGQSDPIDLKPASEASYLLQRLRDEAHRFAITANRGSRDKKMTQSAIDDIPGVGPKIKRRLLMHFGSASAVRAATQEEIAAVAGALAAESIKANL